MTVRTIYLSILLKQKYTLSLANLNLYPSSITSWEQDNFYYIIYSQDRYKNILYSCSNIFIHFIHYYSPLSLCCLRQLSLSPPSTLFISSIIPSEVPPALNCQELMHSLHVCDIHTHTQISVNRTNTHSLNKNNLINRNVRSAKQEKI